MEENGSLENRLAWGTRRLRGGRWAAQRCTSQLFFRRTDGGLGEEGSRREEEKWRKEFLIHIIPWFSARSQVWEFCGVGSGTKENVICQGQQCLTLIQILALGGRCLMRAGGRGGMNRWHLALVGDRRRLQLAHSVSSMGGISRTNRVTS